MKYFCCFRQIYGRTDPFYLYMSEIEEELGTVQGVQVNKLDLWFPAEQAYDIKTVHFILESF